MNIEILTLSEITAIDGEEGDFTVSIKQAPRYVEVDLCIACGTCAEKCPRQVPDEYEEGLGVRKAIYVPYPQAVPLKYTIDAGNCIYFEKGKCRACEKFCPTGAIRFDQTEKELTLQAGSVIITTGFAPFDPSGLDNYPYASCANIITSLEFERLLSAGGPTKGALQRFSDGQPPAGIAWLQCVGSRDINKCDNPYCSSVCCMYALKEAMLAGEHGEAELETAIFFTDMRTCGKEFEKYYERAKSDGVRFVRSRIHTITEEADGSLRFRYTTENGTPVEETFDLVVLSVGMEASPATRRLAKKLGVRETDEGLLVSVFDPILETRLEIEADLLNLATAIEPADPADIARLFKLSTTAENISALCKGCGICAAACPRKAIDMKHFRDTQIEAALAAGME